MEQCHHTVQGADASCHPTVEMWILNLQDFCLFLSLRVLLLLKPHPKPESRAQGFVSSPEHSSTGLWIPRHGRV